MRSLIVALLTLVLLLAGCGQDGGSGTASDAESNGSGSGDSPSAASSGATKEAPETVAIDTSGKDGVRVRVEIADDTNEMARGLMGRTALAEDAGMLFAYTEERDLSFWMKDTLIPLSIAFMDSEGRIVDIQDMKALDDTPPHYASAEPAQYALEVNKGFFAERGVEVGDRARLPV
ncbi:MAG: DUF192 domain-containing protein [Rubrobacter sp.]